MLRAFKLYTGTDNASHVVEGTLEFTTRDGETFVMRPGDVLVALDDVGSGHKWRLVDDQPWRRAYVVLKPGARDSFVPKPK
jgi:uncharacterized cupin superfamily protein